MNESPQPTPAADRPHRSRKAVKRIGGPEANAARWFRRALWVGLALLAIGLGSRPLYRQLRRQRALSAVRAAEQFALQHRNVEAARRFKVAYDLAPLEPQVLRAAARFASQSGSTASMPLWERLLSMDAATDEDRVAGVEEAFRYSRLDLATKELKRLDTTRPEDLEVQHLKLRLLHERRDAGSERRLAEQLLQKHPDDHRTQFALGTILQSEPRAADRQVGRRLLWGLAVGRGSYRDEAVELLVPDRELGRGELEVLLRSLRGATNATVRTYIQRADLGVRLDPAKRREAGNELAALSPVSPAEQLLVAGWLGRNGLFEEALQYVPAGTARTNGPLLGVRFEALGALNRWPEIEHILENGGDELDHAIASLFRGELAARTGKREQAVVHFRAAADACTNRADRLFLIARRASRAGFPEVGVDALMRLLPQPRFTVAAARETLRLLEPLDNFTANKRVVERLAEYLPGDPSVATELAYHRLVLSEDVGPTRDRMRELHAAHGSETEVRLTLAFAHLRAQQPEAALGLVDSVTWDWKSASPRWQAVYAAILAGNQQRGAAREVALQIDQKLLRTEERELLRGLL